MQAIRGKKVNLIPATLRNRRTIFNWMTHSDISKYMFGPPLFPEVEAPNWQEFQEDYVEYYFTDDFPLKGRCFIIKNGRKHIGQINYNSINLKNKQVELDIWLANSAYTGQGFGKDALDLLCNYLNEEFGVEHFIIQPSMRNPQAIKAYQKAGFRKVDGIPLGMESDYYDSVFMIKKIG